MAANLKVWGAFKQEDIMTYRDKDCFASPCDGTVGVLHHTPWILALDDSMKTFMATKLQ